MGKKHCKAAHRADPEAAAVQKGAGLGTVPLALRWLLPGSAGKIELRKDSGLKHLPVA